MAVVDEPELLTVFDPLIRVAMNYTNRMRDGRAPYDSESWILIKRALHAGFEIPEGTLPDTPMELKEPLKISSPVADGGFDA